MPVPERILDRLERSRGNIDGFREILAATSLDVLRSLQTVAFAEPLMSEVRAELHRRTAPPSILDQIQAAARARTEPFALAPSPEPIDPAEMAGGAEEESGAEDLERANRARMAAVPRTGSRGIALRTIGGRMERIALVGIEERRGLAIGATYQRDDGTLWEYRRLLTNAEVTRLAGWTPSESLPARDALVRDVSPRLTEPAAGTTAERVALSPEATASSALGMPSGATWAEEVVYRAPDGTTGLYRFTAPLRPYQIDDVRRRANGRWRAATTRAPEVPSLPIPHLLVSVGETWRGGLVRWFTEEERQGAGRMRFSFFFRDRPGMNVEALRGRMAPEVRPTDVRLPDGSVVRWVARAIRRQDDGVTGPRVEVEVEVIGPIPGPEVRGVGDTLHREVGRALEQMLGLAEPPPALDGAAIDRIIEDEYGTPDPSRTTDETTMPPRRSTAPEAPSQLTLLPAVRPTGRLSHVGIRLLPDGVAADPALVESIRTFGVLQPVALIELPDRSGGPNGSVRYRVAAGRRRTWAARAVGLETVPALVFPPETPDHVAAAMALAENSRRAPNPLSDYWNIRQMMRAGAREGQIATELGLPIRTVRARLLMGNLLPELAREVETGGIPAALAESVARLTHHEQQAVVGMLNQRPGGPAEGRRISAEDLREIRERFTEEAGPELPFSPGPETAVSGVVDIQIPSSPAGQPSVRETENGNIEWSGRVWRDIAAAPAVEVPAPVNGPFGRIRWDGREYVPAGSLTGDVAVAIQHAESRGLAEFTYNDVTWRREPAVEELDGHRIRWNGDEWIRQETADLRASEAMRNSRPETVAVGRLRWSGAEYIALADHEAQVEAMRVATVTADARMMADRPNPHGEQEEGWALAVAHLRAAELAMPAAPNDDTDRWHGDITGMISRAEALQAAEAPQEAPAAVPQMATVDQIRAAGRRPVRREAQPGRFVPIPTPPEAARQGNPVPQAMTPARERARRTADLAAAERDRLNTDADRLPEGSEVRATLERRALNAHNRYRYHDRIARGLPPR